MTNIYRNWIKLFSTIIFILSVMILWYLKYNNYLTPDKTLYFIQNNKKAASIIFLLCHIIAPVLLIPCSPLTVLSGFLWGKLLGSFLALLGATMGSGFTFVIARYLFSDFFRKRFNIPFVKWIFDNVDKYGWRIIAFTQINPIFPASSLGYIYGLTIIPYKVYFITTLIFMLPLNIGLVIFGESMRDIIFPQNKTNLIIPLIIMIVSAFFLFLLKPITRKIVGKLEDNDK